MVESGYCIETMMLDADEISCYEKGLRCFIEIVQMLLPLIELRIEAIANVLGAEGLSKLRPYRNKMRWRSNKNGLGLTQHSHR